MQTSMFEDKKILPKSVYKSACQKHVRRGNVEAALRCAKGNIDQDPLDFARRVMVIAPEDVSIHPLMPRMVEIIQRLSKSGEVATDTDKSMMLTIVRDAASANFRDCWEYKPETKFVLKKAQFDYLSQWQKDILLACRFRGSIGGLKGDVHMFESMINHAGEKWVNGEKYTYEMFYGEALQAPTVNYSLIKEATIEDIPWYALDFHCFPPLIGLSLNKPEWENGEKRLVPTPLKTAVEDLIGKMDKKYYNNEQFVKDMIWYMSSATNYKLDYETGEVLNTAKAEGFSQNDIHIFEYCFEIIKPIWSSIYEWYMEKYF